MVSSQPDDDPQARCFAPPGSALAGLTFTGAAGEIAAGALSHPPAAPEPPRWHSRPDLQIPPLTVTHSEQGVSSDPIFIAPYNAPKGQAGAVIVDNDGQPIWENPLAGKVTTNFRVQSYRGSPVLTWWEGNIELGHGVGEYVIADSSYRTVRRVQAARGLRGDLHEFVITPRDTALLTSYVVKKADLSAVGGSRAGHDPGRDLPGDRPRHRQAPARVAQPRPRIRWRIPTRR